MSQAASLKILRSTFFEDKDKKPILDYETTDFLTRKVDYVFNPDGTVHATYELVAFNTQFGDLPAPEPQTCAQLTRGTKQLIILTASRLNRFLKQSLLTVAAKTKEMEKEKAGTNAIKKFLKTKQTLSLANKMTTALASEPPVAPENIASVINVRWDKKMENWEKQKKKQARKKSSGGPTDTGSNPTHVQEKNGGSSKKRKPKHRHTQPPKKAKRVRFNEEKETTPPLKNPYKKSTPRSHPRPGRGMHGGRGPQQGRGKGRGRGNTNR